MLVLDGAPERRATREHELGGAITTVPFAEKLSCVATYQCDVAHQGRKV
jgi:hypothetical protein